MSIILSVWTVIVLVLFLGIVAWAWHANNKADFDDAAMIPLNDDDSAGPHDGSSHG